MSQSLQAFYEVAEEDLRDKNDDQIRRWKNPRIKAIANFLKVHRDMPLAEITTEDMFAFRKWWVDRTMKGDGKADTADKDLTHLIGMWKRVARSKGLQLGYQTEGLMLRSGKDKDDARPPFSLEWIRDKLIVPDALARMNGDARLILLGMINTGYRPGEGAGLAPEDIKLDAAIPHIIIRPNNNRSLKNMHSKRQLPLVGISLEAFKAAPQGFPRYAASSASLSATVNKFLAENNLLETPDHSLYSLRHSFEDRMLAAGIDERVRRDLIGHALGRQRYGDGGSLEFLRDQLLKVAL